MTEKEVKAKNAACDHNCDDCDDECDFLTLEFDDGATVECEILGIFACKGKEYIALLPDDDSEDVYLYGYKEVGDEEFELVDIVDDAEFEEVCKEFEAITAEEDEEK